MNNILKIRQGQQYKVKKSFTDYDGLLHEMGEVWTYLGTNFLPYEDGLTLHVQKNNQEVVYRLQWRMEEQAEIIENFQEYVELC